MERHSGLPVGVAAFVGRERERAKVAELVAGDRVVTLTGTGGCGKTRLAVEVAGDVAARFADGACWVDLQGVSEAGMVAAAVAAAVGVHERPGQALSDTLAEQLGGRQPTPSRSTSLTLPAASTSPRWRGVDGWVMMFAGVTLPMRPPGDSTLSVLPTCSTRVGADFSQSRWSSPFMSASRAARSGNVGYCPTVTPWGVST
jgi:hypothetical protein